MSTHPLKRWEFAGTNDRIEFLDSERLAEGDSNVIRVGADGEVIWRAELPEPSSWDAYVTCTLSSRGLWANSASGYRVRLDVETGAITTSTFTK